jgi:hypothetical protein
MSWAASHLGASPILQVYVGGKLIVDDAKFMTRDESEVRKEIDTRVDRLRGEIEAKEKTAAALEDAPHPFAVASR